MKARLLFIMFLILPSFAFAKYDAKWVRLGSAYSNAEDFKISDDNQYYIIQSNGYTNFINLSKGNKEFSFKFIGQFFYNKENDIVELFHNAINIRFPSDGALKKKIEISKDDYYFYPSFGKEGDKPGYYIADFSKTLNKMAIKGAWEYNPDTNKLALWDVVNGKFDRIIDNKSDDILSIKFVPGSNDLIIGRTAEVCILDVETGQKKKSIASNKVSNISISDDNKYMAYLEYTGNYIPGYGDQYKCVIRRIEDFSKLQEFIVYKFTYPFPFSPDNNNIAIIAQDQRYAEIRNIQNGTIVNRVELPKFSNIHSVNFDKSGEILVFSEGYTGTSWKYDINKAEWSTLTGASFKPDLLQYSPDGKYIAAAQKKEYITIFDTLGNIHNRIDINWEGEEFIHHGQLHFSPDNSRLVYCNEEEKRFLVCDADPNSDFTKTIEESDLVKDVGYSPDGKRIAAALEKKGIKLYDAQSFNPVKSIQVKENFVIKRMAYFSDKLIYALVSDHTNEISSLLKWDIETNEVEYLFAELLNYHIDIKFTYNSNNKYLLAYPDVINLETETVEQAPYAPYGAYSMDIAKDGSYAVIAPMGSGIGYEESYFYTWKLPAKVITGKYDYFDEVKYYGIYSTIHQTEMRFSPNGGSLVSCTSEGDIILWNLKDTTTSVPDGIRIDDNYTAFPQPATTTLTIRSAEDRNIERIELYDFMGNRIREWRGERIIGAGNATTIDISNEASGAYNLRIVERDGITNRVIIIHK